LKAVFATFPLFQGLHIYTWDGAQGDEAKVVIVNPVEIGADVSENLGFLSNLNRLNVVLIRAKVGGIVVAHMDMTSRVWPTRGRSGWDDLFRKHQNYTWPFPGRGDYIGER
jgi:superfamily I DNA and/or RNA helicase